LNRKSFGKKENQKGTSVENGETGTGRCRKTVEGIGAKEKAIKKGQKGK